MSLIIRFLLLTGCIVFLSGCAQSTLINRGNVKSYNIMCGAATGWSVCYNEANKLCPSGYKDISKQSGFNRKELVIECFP
ncbi:hypothetical protein ZQ65_19105 [Salmonella enterica subsp. enterica serovar Newport]|uniref:Lipoprotein n=1 Tax=Salmonella newport TaxID=108619 RepID=A0A5U9KW52_SALNE|nr:hypothetical protein [Salmonella enterica subsp. enterica serovar Newport]ECN8541834.1 hypothetical protein [Salmonella enterica subsp. enterica serovar Newport]